jgi:hypothetical protein
MVKRDEADEDGDAKALNRYSAIILDVFKKCYRKGKIEFVFDRDDLEKSAEKLNVKRPKNLGDIIYTFRYRKELPSEIIATQSKGLSWLILGAGDAKYRFRLSRLATIVPTAGLLVRKIPDATPKIISSYALNDEQALLAKVRYNRLIDIFLSITAYSLQNHLRTKITNYGQIEIDELYVGVDSRGVQYIVPVQAKGGRDKLGAIQTIQDTMFCVSEPKYRQCVPRTCSAQFLDNDTIALFELAFDGDEVLIVQEKHYRLVEAKQITESDLKLYNRKNGSA